MSRVLPHIRDIVLIRDGYKCSLCASREGLTIDHIIEVKRGGSDSIDNLRTLCVRCHQRRNGNTIPLNSVHEKNITMGNLAMSALRYGIAKNYEEAMKLVKTI